MSSKSIVSIAIAGVTVTCAITFAAITGSLNFPYTTNAQKLDDAAHIISQVAEHRLEQKAYSDDIIRRQLQQQLLDSYKQAPHQKQVMLLNQYKAELNNKIATVQ